MFAAFFLFAGIVVSYFLCTSHALQTLPISQDLAFYLLALLNTAQLFGRIEAAFITDQIGAEMLLRAADAAAAVLGFCWLAVSTETGYIFWLLTFGFISGMIVTLPAVVLAFVCSSMAVIGTRLGMLYAAAGIGVLISTPVATALDGRTSGFLGAQVWISECSLAGLLLYSVTTREAWRGDDCTRGRDVGEMYSIPPR